MLAALLAAGASMQARCSRTRTRARAILDLRQRWTRTSAAGRSRPSRPSGFRRNLLWELNNQIEAIKSEIARACAAPTSSWHATWPRCSGKQKDVGRLPTNGLRKLEPQPVTVDGEEFIAEPDERRRYDDALALLQGDFAGRRPPSSPSSRWPKSGYAESAQFWLGNAVRRARVP